MVASTTNQSPMNALSFRLANTMGSNIYCVLMLVSWVAGVPPNHHLSFHGFSIQKNNHFWIPHLWKPLIMVTPSKWPQLSRIVWICLDHNDRKLPPRVRSPSAAKPPPSIVVAPAFFTFDVGIPTLCPQPAFNTPKRSPIILLQFQEFISDVFR